VAWTENVKIKIFTNHLPKILIKTDSKSICICICIVIVGRTPVFQATSPTLKNCSEWMDAAHLIKIVLDAPLEVGE
jgi:hypothetical protein